MAVPRNRSSNARKNSRRAHHAKKPVFLSECTQCGVAVRPHTICGACGYYRGRQLVKVAEEKTA